MRKSIVFAPSVGEKKELPNHNASQYDFNRSVIGMFLFEKKAYKVESAES
jgi:hypothetical protein